MRIRAGLPTGVTALLHDTARERRSLEARLCGRLQSEGFDEVLLPILDYYDPYGPLLGAESRERLYRFVDRDGQLLALRGDFTPMLARLLAPQAASLELPARLFYRGDVVRYQDVRPGQMREYSELGAEVLDRVSACNDEPVLQLFVSLLASELAELSGQTLAGVPQLHIVVGLAGGLDALLVEAEDTQRLASAVARRDRRAAQSHSQALLEVVENGWPESLDALGKAGDRVQDLLKLCQTVQERFSGCGAAEQGAPIGVSVDLAEFAEHTLDPTLGGCAADRNYYDGLMFRAYLSDDAEPVGSGGRYDGLFRTLGADIGATGFSIGLDRLLERRRVSVAEEQELAQKVEGASR